MIDLYQTHFFDPDTPIDETLRALDDLVRAGKVRYVGCSNYPRGGSAEADARARELGLTRYDSLQPRYNLLYREIETELLPLCRAGGLGVIVYNPLAGGFLSGKYTHGRGAARRHALHARRRGRDLPAPLLARGAARARSRSSRRRSSHAGWRWPRWRWPGCSRSRAITSAIIGASRPEQLDATLAAAELDARRPSSRKLCDELWWELPRRPVTEGYR